MEAGSIASRGRLLAPTAVGLAATLPYLLGLSHGFVAEDFDVLFISSLSAPHFVQFHARYLERIRFLASIKDWVLYRVAGASPLVYHGGNLLLHLIAALLVAYLGYRLLRDRRVGVLAGVLFAVYPRHHGAVMWLAASQFLLSGVFILGGLALYLQFLSSRRWRYYALALACFVLAILSNEVGMISLPLAVLVDWAWHRERSASIGSGPGGYGKYAVWLALAGGFIVVSFAGSRAFRFERGPLDPRVLIETYQFQGLGTYLAKEMISYLTYMFWPQVPLWELRPNIPSLALAGVTLAGTLALLIRGTRYERVFVIWAVAALMPIVLFVPFGAADRYFYVPAAGMMLALSSLGIRGWDRLGPAARGAGRALLGGLVALYLVSSVALMQVRAIEWHRAGRMARDIVAQTVALQPQVAPDSRLFFVGLPARCGQAYVFMGGGIGSAVRMAYGERRVQVYRSVDPDLQRWLDSGADGVAPEGGCILVYRDGAMEDRSGRVDNLDAFLSAWWWYR
jgi:hypothetical protein